MIDRTSLGVLPKKPHTVHRTPTGGLLYEEMFTRGGFDGPYSYLYHLHPVTSALRVTDHTGFTVPTRAESGLHPVMRRLYDGNAAWERALAKGGASTAERTPFLFNADIALYLAAPTEDDPVFFANNDGDELHYLFEGKARFETVFGVVDAVAGDYVGIPRSVIHRVLPDPKAPPKVMVVEARRDLYLPASYRNPVGQLTMNAPYTERDFIRPTAPIATFDHVPDGPKDLLVKRLDRFSMHALPRCPLDVVGWDGFVYPYVFAIEKFQPKIGQVHLPPTVHTTFLGPSYVVCSFVPRAVDFHPEAIPCPYPHSSVDCDEVLLYLRGNFTSRRGVGPGCLSLHPMGIAHGPHPGAYEASIGTKWTDEMAVMIDTLQPLFPTPEALGIEREGYHGSWAPA